MKVCDTPPPHCAACFGQYVDRRHVDLEAAYDGPVVQGGVMGEDGEVQSHIPVSIDELVLCENCLRDAGALIGLVPEDSERLSELEARLQRQAEELVGLREYNARLEAAVAARPTPAPKRTKARA